MKLVEGRLPTIPEQRWDKPTWSLLQAVLAVVMLAAIALAWLTAPAGGLGFIYENF